MTQPPDLPRGSPRDGSVVLGWRGALAFFLLLDAILFLPVFLAGPGYALGWAHEDSPRQVFYWHEYASERLLAGELPLWNPRIFAGIPFVASIQNAVYYPPNLLYLVMSTGGAMVLLRFLHLLWMQAGTWLLAAEAGAGPAGSLLAAVAFSFSTAHTYRIYEGAAGLTDGMAWMPWVFLGVLRTWRAPGLRLFVWTAAAAALQVLSGHQQLVYFSWLALAILGAAAAWVGARPATAGLLGLARFVGLTLATGVTAAMLAAAALLPALELVAGSNRGAAPPAFIGSFSLPPENLLGMLMPTFFGGGPEFGPYWGKLHIWETTAYVGLVPLLLASRVLSKAWRSVALAWLVLVEATLLLSFGTNTPLYLPIAKVVPLLSMFRGPCKFMIPLTLALAVLAGLGLGTLERPRTATARAGRNVVLWALLLVVIGSAALLWSGALDAPVRAWYSRYIQIPERYDVLPPVTDSLVRQVSRQSALALIGLAAMGLAALGVARAADTGRLTGAWAARSMVGLACVDLLLTGLPYMATYPESFCRLPAPLETALRARVGVPDRAGAPPACASGPFRVAVRTEAGPNCLMNTPLETVAGYEGILPRTTGDFYDAMQGVEKSLVMLRQPDPSPGTRLLAQRFYVFRDGKTRVPQGLVDGGRLGEDTLWVDPNAVPRVRLKSDFRVLASREAVLEAVRAPVFTASGPVLLEEDPGFPSSEDGPSQGSVKVLSLAAESMVVDARVGRACLLVVGDAWYPSWRAFVDDRPVPLLRAYGFVRAVVLQPGRHLVELRFDSTVARLGLGLSALAWLALLAGLWLSRNPKARPHPEAGLL